VDIAPAALQEINRLRIVGPVVSNVVHDINNALQVIGGSAELLAMRSEIGPTEARRIQTIAAQADRISTTLDRLTTFTRAGVVGRQVVDLAELVDHAVLLRAFTLNRARIEVTVERADPPCVASIDRGRILQIFLNLLLNAEVALADRPESTVHIRLERSGKYCSVVFADNGPGIGPEGRARLADTAAIHGLSADLTGIGLWVSARIAEQHGGRLDITDTPAPGASLRLSLPGA
jgi:signal transduction histidine kinase